VKFVHSLKFSRHCRATRLGVLLRSWNQAYWFWLFARERKPTSLISKPCDRY